jgi:hypothetical protein
MAETKERPHHFLTFSGNYRLFKISHRSLFTIRYNL